jgi:ribosomal protein L29
MTKKKNTLPTLSAAELATLLEDTRASLRSERFAAAGARPKDSNAPRKLRKTIARVQTEQRARELKTAA